MKPDPMSHGDISMESGGKEVTWCGAPINKEKEEGSQEILRSCTRFVSNLIF